MSNTESLTTNTYAAEPLADLAECYVTIGHVFAAQYDWERALVWFERALSYVPENAAYGCLTATAYEKAGRLPEAISTAAEVIRTVANENEIVDSLSVIGRCCAQLRDPFGALQAWTILNELRPDRADVWHGLAASAREVVRSMGTDRGYGVGVNASSAEIFERRVGDDENRDICPLCGR